MVLGIANAEKRMAEVFEQALDLALEKKDPQRKLERRKKKAQWSRSESRPDEVEPEKGPQGEGDRLRKHDEPNESLPLEVTSEGESFRLFVP